MILDLVSFCSDPVLARVLGIIKNVLGKIQLIGPILGIIALIINNLTTAYSYLTCT